MLMEGSSAGITLSPRGGLLHVACFQACQQLGLPSVVTTKDGFTIAIEKIFPDHAGEYLDNLGNRTLAVTLIGSDNIEKVPEPLQSLRSRPDLARTRVYLIAPTTKGLSALKGVEDFDVEDVLDSNSLTAGSALRTMENGVRAYHALGTNPLVPQYYLDAAYNKVFDWFETTRWDWHELGDLSNIQKDLLTEGEIEILKETAIIEFGTLPGAHNFLREWSDEYSFSSWALAWGAEEARHSLVQCRYLREIGIDIRAKHAMYKREPYPMGDNRAATLMMNIISEARASEYYKVLSKLTREPVLKRIWKLLGRDEARHARAFFVFCKELCDQHKENTIAALRMAYVWLADRGQGVKHPAGFFYPHSTSTKGLRRLEKYREGMTDAADEHVLAMIRNLLHNDTMRSVRDLKSWLRELA